MGRLILALSLLLGLLATAQADSSFGAEFRLQQQAWLTRNGDLLQAAIGGSAWMTTSSLRLKAQGQSGPWSYDFQYVLQGTYSRVFSDLGMSSPQGPGASLLDLESEIGRSRYGSLEHRVDRASMTYATPRAVIGIGRQALTWGRGQVFQPLDLFNPFSPDAPDRSYKPGADMVYAQYLFDNGADVQAIVVPRRGGNGRSGSDNSSAAIKGLWPVGSLELEAVMASDYGDPVVAIGAAGPFGDALWKFDVVATRPQDSSTVISAVVNLNSSWDWGGKPVSAFVEYYRNGFGVTDRRPADRLPVELSERVARGQIFATGRDYLDVGGTVDWTPLLQIRPTVVMNLNDRSLLTLVTARYSLSNQSNLIISAQLPLGDRGSEYGGRSAAAGTAYDRTPDTFFVRYERFF